MKHKWQPLADGRILICTLTGRRYSLETALKKLLLIIAGLIALIGISIEVIEKWV